MWTCPKCNRTFKREGQPHSCKSIPIEQHFNNKELAKELFDALLERVNKDIISCKILSLPCCVHLFGNRDFVATLPRKDRLELHFSSSNAIESPRIARSIQTSKNVYLNYVDITKREDIDDELMDWLRNSHDQR